MTIRKITSSFSPSEDSGFSSDAFLTSASSLLGSSPSYSSIPKICAIDILQAKLKKKTSYFPTTSVQSPGFVVSQPVSLPWPSTVDDRASFPSI